MPPYESLVKKAWSSALRPLRITLKGKIEGLQASEGPANSDTEISQITDH